MSLRSLLIAPALALGFLMCSAPSARAQATDPNPGNLTIAGAADFTNNYMFRGIRQDIDPKVIVQPYFDLGIALHSADNGLKSAGVNFGTWNSLHTGASGFDSASGKLWYESDFYAAVGLGFGAGVFNAQYTSYTSPNAGFTTVKEIFLKFTGDDSAVLGRASLHPYGLIAVELDTAPGIGQADGGFKAGKYLELGVAPGFAAPRIGIAVPVKVGLSVGDYYELDGEDHRFGYFSAAGVVTIP